jgi:outer membrane beta-barrel protein
MNARFLVATLALALAALSASPAFAADDADVQEQQRVVIQNRKYSMGAEIALQGATLPLDPFYKGVAGTGRLTWHFNDFHAWEIISGTYAYNINSALTDQLFKNFGVQNAQLPGLQLMLESDYMMTPFYGKFALANRTLLYQEVFLVAGATVTQWTDPVNTFRAGPNVGGGMRFFLNDVASVRFDLRYAVVASAVPQFDGIFPVLDDPSFTLDGVLFLGAGLSLNFGGGA